MANYYTYPPPRPANPPPPIPRSMYYRLNPDKTISSVDATDLSGINTIMKDHNNVVKQEEVGSKWVSTVFLHIDHGYGKEGQPTLFETMVFTSKTNLTDEQCKRYYTYKDALEGHKKVVSELKEQLGIKEIKKERLTKTLQLR